MAGTLQRSWQCSAAEARAVRYKAEHSAVIAILGARLIRLSARPTSPNCLPLPFHASQCFPHASSRRAPKIAQVAKATCLSGAAGSIWRWWSASRHTASSASSASSLHCTTQHAWPIEMQSRSWARLAFKRVGGLAAAQQAEAPGTPHRVREGIIHAHP